MSRSSRTKSSLLKPACSPGPTTSPSSSLIVGTILNGETRLTSADHHVPIWEASGWRGCYQHSFRLIFALTFVDPQEQAEFWQVPCGYLSFCVCFPSPSAPGSGIQLRTANSTPMNNYGSRRLAL